MNAGPPSVETILSQAVEITSADDRQRFLDQACGGDAELRRQVEELVRHHFAAGSFLESPALTPTVAALAPPEGAGTLIGPYKLLEQIGEGGMGVVYMAEQQQPVRRRVALKIIKPGMDTREVIARFEAERQALALMDHPEHRPGARRRAPPRSGRPYFVMELVHGVPITEYCDQAQARRSRERLELFITVCQAVQHAHQKGIIHRDLKPSNVLVTLHDGTPVPKVIDFGVAKATSQQLTEQTLYTGFAQMIGTPAYMSPEQAELERAGRRHAQRRLFAGRPALRTADRARRRSTARRCATPGYDEIPPHHPRRRSARPQQPHQHAGRRSDLDDRRAPRQRAAQARALLRGELDWIVMKALEKDRNRRYETASAFAADVERYLNDEPVEACPPSAAYRLRKFLRRNKGPVVAASLVLLTLVGGIIGTSWQAVRAKAAQAGGGKRNTCQYERGQGQRQRGQSQYQRGSREEGSAEGQTIGGRNNVVFTFFEKHVLAAAAPRKRAGWVSRPRCAPPSTRLSRRLARRLATGLSSRRQCDNRLAKPTTISLNGSRRSATLSVRRQPCAKLVSHPTMRLSSQPSSVLLRHTGVGVSRQSLS